MDDIAFTLSSGTVIRIRNIVVFRGPTGSRLNVFVQTPTPPTDRARVALEAKEIAGLKLASASTDSAGTVIVVVCRTQACLEMREMPPEIFLFVRQTDGSWQPITRPDAL
jgi:hypothetical protein